jgi:hypothetical protein
MKPKVFVSSSSKDIGVVRKLIKEIVESIEYLFVDKNEKEMKKLLDDPELGRELIKTLLTNPEVNKKKKSSIVIEDTEFSVKELG